MFVALGLVLPMAFHAFGLAGQIFSPMHIPVLVGGLVLGAEAGLAIGLVTPLLSSVLTGMPPWNMPVLYLMMLELAAYGALSGYLMQRRRNLYLALLGAMVGGRIVLALGAVVTGLLVPFPGVVTYMSGVLLTGLPGILLHLVLVPAMAYALMRTPVKSPAA
jgi:hypothetical protein